MGYLALSHLTTYVDRYCQRKDRIKNERKFFFLCAPYLSYVPGRPGVIQNPRSDLALGASSRVDHTSLPFTALYQGRNRMPQVDLVRPARQPMQDDQHGPVVIGAQSRELVLAEVDGPRRQGLVDRLLLLRGRLDDEVDGEAPVELPVVGVEDPPLVVDGRGAQGHLRPHRLRVPVEDQRVEAARRHGRLTHL